MTVLIGNMPAWKGIPVAMGPGLQAKNTATESMLQALETTAKVAEAAALAGAGTPAGPGPCCHRHRRPGRGRNGEGGSAAANAASIAAAAAGGASMHTCALPWPIPPHGPGVVINGSPTVMIENCPACRQGDTIIEAIGPPNTIMMGCMTVSRDLLERERVDRLGLRAVRTARRKGAAARARPRRLPARRAALPR